LVYVPFALASCHGSGPGPFLSKGKVTMGRSVALLLAAIVAAGAATAASAADLLPPPPPIEAPPLAPEYGGWYLRGDVGVGINQIDEFRSTLAPVNGFGGAAPAIALTYKSIGDSALFSAGFGYQFNNWLRADLTGEYRSSADYHVGEIYTAFCPTDFCPDNYTATTKTALFLANGYVDLGTWRGVTPYVGAGVGAAFHTFGALTDIGLGQGFATARSQTNFAWAIMAGLGYNITPNLKLELGYRYIDMGRLTSNPILCSQLGGCFFETQSYHATAHDLRVGFRYAFGGEPRVLYPAPGPLVSKY
jgi:opacity protein-like surface antigen